MELPCKECLKFAICKQKNKIYCKVLYEYFCSTIDENIRFFDSYNIKLLKEAERYFNKHVILSISSINAIYFTTVYN